MFCFCDETLCRTVAMLPCPSSRRSATTPTTRCSTTSPPPSCSTPTHAAETAVPCHCGDARTRLARDAPAPRGPRPPRGPRSARACSLASRALRSSTSPGSARACTSSCARCGPAARGGLRDETALLERERLVLSRKATAADVIAGRREKLDALALALAAHDPERTLARGYALVEDERGEILTTAEAARAAGAVRIRFADDAVKARTE